METSNLQLTPELRAAIAANPDAPLYIEDTASRKTYLIIENGKFPDLQEHLVREKLEEGYADLR